MAPVSLTPLSEESLPNYPGKKTDLKEEDRGCLFFYDSPQVRGSFAKDNFFRSVRSNKAFEEMLGRPKMEVSCLPDESSSGMTDAGDHFQIVVDVTGYTPSDISVKAVGDKELLVEGRRVGTRPDGSSVNSCFSRRFVLPGLVELDRVTSGLSSDGVLTVRAPKATAHDQNRSFVEERHLTKAAPFHRGEISDDRHIAKAVPFHRGEFDDFVTDLELESRMKQQMGFGDRLDLVETGSKGITPEMVEGENDFKITLDTKGYSPQDISVKALGDKEIQIEGKHVEKSETGSETNKSFNRKFCLPQLVKLNEIRSSLSRDGLLTVTAPKLKTDNYLTNTHAPSPKSSMKSSHSNMEKQFNTTSTVPFNDPIDDFFTRDFDSPFSHRNNRFMEDARNDYNKSLQSIMKTDWMKPDPIRTELMRPDHSSDFFAPVPIEPEMSKKMSDIIENEKDFQMKLDVSGYKPEDISVKSVGDRELLIEGKHKADNSAGAAVTQTFTRRFCLPSLANMDSVRTLLSSDGTLTITAPKMIS